MKETTASFKQYLSNTRISEKQLNEEEIRNLSDKEFRVTLVKMFIRLSRKLDEFDERVTKAQASCKPPSAKG